MPFERARTLLALGLLQRRRNERRRAQESLEQALAIFDELGAPLWAARARRELRPLGGRPTSRVTLTPAEQRVAELAASGLTNRQVAAALFISPKTVESTLARAYRKLGIRSRAELGAHVAAADRPRGCSSVRERAGVIEGNTRCGAGGSLLPSCMGIHERRAYASDLHGRVLLARRDRGAAAEAGARGRGPPGRPVRTPARPATSARSWSPPTRSRSTSSRRPRSKRLPRSTGGRRSRSSGSSRSSVLGPRAPGEFRTRTDDLARHIDREEQT